MSCLRLRTLRISVLAGAVSVPNCAAFRTRWATGALQISFLEGGQATAGHAPPTQRRSTTATFFPERARCHASSFPPWPLPRITTSNCSICDIIILSEVRSVAGGLALFGGPEPRHNHFRGFH